MVVGNLFKFRDTACVPICGDGFSAFNPRTLEGVKFLLTITMVKSKVIPTRFLNDQILRNTDTLYPHSTIAERDFIKAYKTRLRFWYQVKTPLILFSRTSHGVKLIFYSIYFIAEPQPGCWKSFSYRLVGTDIHYLAFSSLYNVRSVAFKRQRKFLFFFFPIFSISPTSCEIIIFHLILNRDFVIRHPIRRVRKFRK